MAHETLQNAHEFRASNSVRRFRAEHTRVMLSFACITIDAIAIISAVMLSGIVYHWGILGVSAPRELIQQAAVLLTLFILLPSAARQDYEIGSVLNFESQPKKLFLLWNMAFAATIIVGFLTKTSAGFSRGTVVLAYGSGILALLLARFLSHKLVMQIAKTRPNAARRIFLVGFEREIMDFATKYQPWNFGMQIVGTSVIPDMDTMESGQQGDALLDAASQARNVSPDDIIILMDWRNRDLIDLATDAFLAIPASIHLGFDASLDRFRDMRVSQFGNTASLQIVRRPLSLGNVFLKRSFDIFGSYLGLVMLLPVFVVIAIAIKLESRGPVFFVQRRYGFNQQAFRIFKFRTMLTMEDGPVVRQATPNDPRITRVGRILRKLNLDELPQLWNVLEGTMSLVGPRPHALAHDTEYEKRIALYARRHNVKPGITGWAQVNGFRGATLTDDLMRARVEHDLHYIDNWSLWLDAVIILRTILSRKAYRNAQ